MANNYHNPVLLSATVDGIIANPDGTFVDVTFGGGGHSRHILEKISLNGRLFGFDQDSECLAGEITDSRFQFVPQNFKNMKKWLDYYGAGKVDGILADLGVSSHQFDTPERGFSYRFSGRLDMRMNTAKEFSAIEVVNDYAPTQLTNLFFTYGELSNARRIAELIVKRRTEKRITTTDELTAAVMPALAKGKENKALAQIFQAIRIEVNGEVDALKQFLQQSAEVLRPGGRIAIISYHSIEDRLVKNFLRAGNFDGNIEKDFYGNPLSPFRAITRKAVVPGEEEIASNPRARSAKLRIAERTEIEQ